MSVGPEDLDASVGRVEPALASEFPGLELRWVTLAARPGSSTRATKQRLRALSDGYRGSRVVALRTQPIAQAYRAFYRHIGLDPDVTRIASEQAGLDRLLHGGFLSRDLVSDALLIAVIETGVPVWALDGSECDAASLGIRAAWEGEALDGVPLVPGRIVVADARRVHALLFQAPAAGCRPGARTRELVLFSVGVDGVPSIYLEEALWLAAGCVKGRDLG
jgi:DNA/RNA-binding domain of Phe-tRNA-synthetase-like protein